MRFLILMTLGLALSHSAIAQKQGNNWFFGYQAGLSFNTAPPSQISGGITGTGAILEGTSAISDSAGRLLFYTDGVTIYTRAHQFMYNGNAIGGHLSSRQSSIIVPMPGSDSLFYVFTADAAEGYSAGAKPLGYNYSVVNMCLDWKAKDSALGAVIAGKKNIHLVDSGTEKLCVASDGAGGYWVLGHKMFSDLFVAWRLTNAGLSAPVFSKIGPKLGGIDTRGRLYGFLGQMKFNPAGNKVAVVNQRSVGKSSTLDLFDFNPSNGQLSSHCQAILFLDSTGLADGVEFSPSSSRVYVSYHDRNDTKYIVQFTNTNGSCSQIADSRDTIYQNSRPGPLPYGLQSGPDGKLYLGINNAVAQKTELHRINNPDGAGTSVSYDTGILVYPYAPITGNIKTVPPSFVAGFKYHNKTCRCPQPVSVLSSPALSARVIEVSPNPSNGLVYFNLQGSQHEEGANLLVIMDAVGRIVYRSATVPPLVDLRGQSRGVYFYSITEGQNQRYFGKFLLSF